MDFEDFNQDQINAIAAAVVAKLTTPAANVPPAATMDTIRVGMSADDSAAVRAECLRVLRGGQ